MRLLSLVVTRNTVTRITHKITTKTNNRYVKILTFGGTDNLVQNRVKGMIQLS